MALKLQPEDFQHILRICNTNIDGRQRVMYAITKIKGIGRRFSNLILKKCDVDMNKRAGELTPEEINKIVAVISNPTQFRIPSWYLNRQRDYKDGKTFQLFANTVDTKLRGRRADEEGSPSPRSSPLLVHQGSWAAHWYVRPPRRYGRRGREEAGGGQVNAFFLTASPPAAGRPFRRERSAETGVLSER